jgi:hypothetical protein
MLANLTDLATATHFVRRPCKLTGLAMQKAVTLQADRGDCPRAQCARMYSKRCRNCSAVMPAELASRAKRCGFSKSRFSRRIM